MTDVTAAPATPAAPASATQSTTATTSENIPAVTAQTNSAPTTPGAAWFSNFDQDTIGWVQSKGYDKLAPNDALNETVKSFRNAEKFLGVPSDRLAKIPDFAKADKAEVEAFYTKLGRPVDPKAYELEIPEGAPTEFADWAKGMFHESGLTASQAKNISAKWNEYQANALKAQEAEYQQKLILENKELRKEWGEAYDREVNLSKGVVEQLDISQEEVAALERTLGFAKLMKMMSRIGNKIGEDMFVTQGNNKGMSDVMTPAAAVARINHLKADKDFILKYTGGNPDAKAEMDRLHRLAYGS